MVFPLHTTWRVLAPQRLAELWREKSRAQQTIPLFISYQKKVGLSRVFLGCAVCLLTAQRTAHLWREYRMEEG